MMGICDEDIEVILDFGLEFSRFLFWVICVFFVI